MKKIVYWATLGCLCVGMASCASPRKTSSIADLEGEWTVVKVGEQTIEATEEQPAPFIGFNVAEKRIYGNAGCNRILGQLNTESDSLALDKLGTTMMMCPNMETETAVLKAFGQSKTFLREGDALTFFDADGQAVVSLTKKEEADQSK